MFYVIFLQQHFKVGLRKQIMEGYFENKPLVGGIEIHLNEFQYFLSQRSHPASSSIDTRSVHRWVKALEDIAYVVDVFKL